MIESLSKKQFIDFKEIDAIIRKGHHLNLLSRCRSNVNDYLVICGEQLLTG